MVRQFTCNSNCAIFDTSLLIVFKPLSSNGGGTQPGSFLASDMWQINKKKKRKVQVAGEAQQLRMSTYPWAGWRGLTGKADILHMCLITYQGAEMILAETWHILQLVDSVYVYHNEAEKSKWPVQEAGRMREFTDMGEWRVWAWGSYSRLCLSVSRVRLVCFSISCPCPTRILGSETIWLNYGQPLLLPFSSGM